MKSSELLQNTFDCLWVVANIHVNVRSRCFIVYYMREFFSRNFLQTAGLFCPQANIFSLGTNLDAQLLQKALDNLNVCLSIVFPSDLNQL